MRCRIGLAMAIFGVTAGVGCGSSGRNHEARSGSPERYAITDLGSGKWRQSHAFGVDSKGTAVGYCFDKNERPCIPTVWSERRAHHLSDGSRQGVVYAACDDGTQAGWLDAPNRRFHYAVAWQKGAVVDLGAPEGLDSVVDDGNSRGEYVGAYGPKGPAGARAVLWSKGMLVHLGNLGGGAEAHGINDKGEIVGTSMLADGKTSRGFKVIRGRLVPLRTLGGPNSSARTINEAGWIAGFSQLGKDGAFHACLWKEGKPIDLGTLGGSASRAYGINGLGQVVGWSLTAGDRAWHAFLWEDGKMVDLGTLGGGNSYAEAINDDGIIVGGSEIAGPQRTRHACLWAPVRTGP